MLDLFAFLATLAVGLLAGFRLGRAHEHAALKSGRAASTLPPDLKALLMALTPAAQTIADAATALPGAIDAYTAAKITDAETALTSQHSEDLDGIKTALQPATDKVATSSTTTLTGTTVDLPNGAAAGTQIPTIDPVTGEVIPPAVTTDQLGAAA